jgi:hypothetical protein
MRYRTLVSLLVIPAWLTACGTAAPPSDAEPSGTSPTPAMIVLTQGAPQIVCGIQLRLVILPPSSTTGPNTQAMLVGEPMGATTTTTTTTGDVPNPAGIVPARAGTTVTVLGQRFAVSTVDLTNNRVTLQALC